MGINKMDFEIPHIPFLFNNFNIEKWRLEHPIDYINIIKFLQEQSSLDVNNQTLEIFKYTKMYLPNKLYKYSSFTENTVLNHKKIETIKARKIYLSDIKDFNDPFDSKAFYYDNNKIKADNKNKPLPFKFIDDFTAFIKSASFTSNGVQSMPMWAHYANNHTGFCVSYEVINNAALFSCTFPIQYTDKRFDITTMIQDLHNSIMNQYNKSKSPQIMSQNVKDWLINNNYFIYILLMLFNIKHSSWSYENEFRCTAASTYSGSPFIDASPKEIFVGMNCNQENTEILIDLAKSLSIPIYKMCFNELSPIYELNTKRIDK